MVEKERSYRTKDIYRLIFDLQDVRHGEVSFPMSWSEAIPVDSQVAASNLDGWAKEDIGSDGSEKIFSAPADVTVSVTPLDYQEPETVFTVAHDDANQALPDGLDYYGAETRAVISGLLDGTYRLDRIDVDGGGGTVLVLAGEGLPDLMAWPSYHDARLHGFGVTPVRPGRVKDPETGWERPARDFYIRVQLTMGGIPIRDTDRMGEGRTLEQAVTFAREVAEYEAEENAA